MSTSRRGPSSTIPKAPVRPHPSATIDPSSTLTGTHPITIHANAVLHPRSRILSTHGPVAIGAASIVHARASIGRPEPGRGGGDDDDDDDADELAEQSGVEIGAGVVVESGAVVAGAKVGDGCVIGVGARVGAGAVLGRGCKVGARCEVGEGELVPEGTVIWGRSSGERRVGVGGEEVGRVEELRRAAHEKQVEGLRRLIKSDLAKFGVTGEAATA